jgi:thiamine biosynthesis lipoprotein
MPAGVELDLGATAKAVAADRCASAIADELDTGVLVSLGGDIATAGRAPAGGWQVLVQDTDLDPAAHIALHHGSGLATSSTARRTWRRGPDTVHHVVDPRTSRPARTPWRTVSVVAGTCTEANTAATATLAKGPEGLSWLAAQGLPARLVGHDLRVQLVHGWPQEVAA